MTGLSYGDRAKRRAKFAGGQAREQRMRRTLLDCVVASKGVKSRSEKSRARWRNDPRRDEEILMYINAKLRSGQPVRLTTKASHTVYVARKNLADAKRAGVRSIPDLFIPHWDHSSDLMKMLGWGLASRELGVTPFTLRIAPEVLERAKADKLGPARHIQERLMRHLRNRLPGVAPTFWFAIEQGQWEEAHVHGAVVIPPDGRKVVAKALAAAGGAWSSPARQVQLDRPKNLITWVGYATKWLFVSMTRVLPDKLSDPTASFKAQGLTGASQTMRRSAKRAYQDARNASAVIYP
jgi:hypothetical protein